MGIPALHVALDLAARRGGGIGPAVLIGFIIAAIVLPFFMGRRSAGALIFVAGIGWIILGGVAFGMHRWGGMIVLLVIVFFTHIIFGGWGRGWGGGGCGGGCGSCGGGVVVVGGCGHGCGHGCGSSCGSCGSSCGGGCGGGCGGCGGCS